MDGLLDLAALGDIVGPLSSPELVGGAPVSKRVVGQGRMTHYLKKTHGPLGGGWPWVVLYPFFNKGTLVL